MNYPTQSLSQPKPAAWFVAGGIVGAITMAAACVAMLVHTMPLR